MTTQTMNLHICSLLFLLSVLMLGCSGASGSNQSSAPALNACALVTADEFAAQQGEALKDAKVTNRSEGDLDISQCFLAAQTFSKSVSVIVTTNTRGKDPTQDMKKLWESKFSVHDNDKDKDADLDREKDKDKDADKDKNEKPANKAAAHDRDDEEEGSNAIKVDGLGDEAFWMGDARAGILYVLKGRSYLRISLGGADDQDTRLTKAKAFATAAMSRMK